MEPGHESHASQVTVPMQIQQNAILSRAWVIKSCHPMLVASIFYVCVCPWARKGWRTACGGPFSPSTAWVPESELRPSGLTRAFTLGDISMPYFNFLLFINNKYKYTVFWKQGLMQPMLLSIEIFLTLAHGVRTCALLPSFITDFCLWESFNTWLRLASNTWQSST